MASLPRRILDLLFFMPSAVPSVSVGLGLLVAFSRPPVLLNGTTLDRRHRPSRPGLGLHLRQRLGRPGAAPAATTSRSPRAWARGPFYRLRRVTLPLLAPYLVGAFSLSFALSMGELGATVMVYPPGWVTLPVGIFALTDRGDVFEGAALTVLLILATLAMLAVLSVASRRPAS